MKKPYLSFLFLLTFETSFSQCWQKVVTTSFTSIGVKTDGTLWSWGRNSSGMLGRGLPSSSTVYPIGQIGTDNDWNSNIFVYAGTVFAIKNNGKLFAWGSNYWGQCGNGTHNNNLLSPQQIGNDNWLTVDTEVSFSAGIKEDGTLWVWGNNGNEQLGFPTSVIDKTFVPIQLSSDTDWVKVSIGNRYGCAIKQDGTMWNWGITNVCNNSSLCIMPDENWLKASCESTTRFAVKTDGTLWAWGANAPVQSDNFFYGNGQIDNNDYTAATPIQIGVDTDWVDVVNSLRYAVALKNNGTIWAWGENSSGELGDGTFVDKYVPTQIGTATNWSYVYMGNSDWRPRYFAINENNDLYKWGFDLDENIAAVTSTTPVLSGTSCALSIDDFEKNNVMVYPNPASQVLNLELLTLQSVSAKVTIVNTLGQVVHREDIILENGLNTTSINVASLPQGVYTLKLKTQNQTYCEKWIKK